MICSGRSFFCKDREIMVFSAGKSVRVMHRSETGMPPYDRLKSEPVGIKIFRISAGISDFEGNKECVGRKEHQRGYEKRTAYNAWNTQ